MLVNLKTGAHVVVQTIPALVVTGTTPPSAVADVVGTTVVTVFVVGSW
jgi:hypothetical protein